MKQMIEFGGAAARPICTAAMAVSADEQSALADLELVAAESQAALAAIEAEYRASEQRLASPPEQDTGNAGGRWHMIADLRRRLWLMAYDLEDRRQRHADLGHVWAEAAYCIGLGLMRLLPAGWR